MHCDYVVLALGLSSVEFVEDCIDRRVVDDPEVGHCRTFFYDCSVVFTSRMLEVLHQGCPTPFVADWKYIVFDEAEQGSLTVDVWLRLAELPDEAQEGKMCFSELLV